MKTQIYNFIEQNHKFISGFVWGCAVFSFINLYVSIVEFHNSITKLETSISKLDSLQK